MRTVEAELALFILSNLPSLLVGGLGSRSLRSAVISAGAIKAAILTLLIILGGGANFSAEEKVVSFAIATAFGCFFGAAGFGLRALKNDWRAASQTAIGAAFFAVYLFGAFAYIFSLWTDARRSNGAYFFADLLIPPFGMIRGILLFFGFV